MSLAIRAASRRMPVRRGSMGDPGLGSILGGIAKGALGFITGGPAGAIAGVASSFMGGGGKPQAMPGGVALPQQQSFAPQQFGASGQWGVTTPWGGIQVGGGIGQFGPGATGAGSALVCAPGAKGVRLNKTGYHLKSGQYVPPGTKCVRVRRRNPLNPRALSRAMGRVVSFKKAAKAASRISIRTGCGCK